MRTKDKIEKERASQRGGRVMRRQVRLLMCAYSAEYRTAHGEFTIAACHESFGHRRVVPLREARALLREGFSDRLRRTSGPSKEAIVVDGLRLGVLALGALQTLFTSLMSFKAPSIFLPWLLGSAAFTIVWAVRQTVMPGVVWMLVSLISLVRVFNFVGGYASEIPTVTLGFLRVVFGAAALGSVSAVIVAMRSKAYRSNYLGTRFAIAVAALFACIGFPPLAVAVVPVLVATMLMSIVFASYDPRPLIAMSFAALVPLSLALLIMLPDSSQTSRKPLAIVVVVVAVLFAGRATRLTRRLHLDRA